MRPSLLITILALAFLCPPLSSTPSESGFKPLFNGRDLSGWARVNCAPNTFTARDGMIVSTGVPTGVMRTTRMYENYILELEWKHIKPGGNAGLFVHSDPITARGQPFTRAHEVQIIDGNHPEGLWTGHGDVFSIHGATFVPDRPHPQGWMRCLPSERRANPAGQWNHYRVECQDGKLSLAVNGKVVSGGTECKPRKGYICLEAEGSECHFRNIRIKEVPGSTPPASEVAEKDKGFKSLYTGIDLSGWRIAPGHEGHWQAKDWILSYGRNVETTFDNLWSQGSYGDFTMIVDWRYPKTPEPLGKYFPGGQSAILLRGSVSHSVGTAHSQTGSGNVLGHEAKQGDYLSPNMRADRPPGEWNRFEITLRGDRLTVVLNGKTVQENVRLVNIPRKGPIGLQGKGEAMEFANLYVKRL
jgi:hypothetical protein